IEKALGGKMRHYSEEEIIDYVYNELNVEETETIKQHLNTCKSCSEIVESFSSLNKSLGAISEEDPKDNSLHSIMEKIEQETAQETSL
ncbi:MAG: hypothetical protein GY908_01625, partial [Flavobacteriales bacterium]|nr:hypothetical protein [Flavobacteriales bacterium]